jgi:hypothetical protein
MDECHGYDERDNDKVDGRNTNVTRHELGEGGKREIELHGITKVILITLLFNRCD